MTNQFRLKITFYSIILLLISSSCTNTKLQITARELPETLGINLINNALIPDEDWEIYLQTTERFIRDYNEKQSKFILYPTEENSNAVNIEFISNKYVTKDQQTTGVIVTTAGIITPILMAAVDAPIIISFWYIPRNHTVVYKSLSPELDEDNKVVGIEITSRHGFDSYEEQKRKQGIKYYEFLEKLLLELEDSHNPIM